jgi:hypothetical protein
MQHPVSDPDPTAHLDAERLAALADEPMTAAEAAHLAACAACHREREAYVALLALARAEGVGDRPADAYAGDGHVDAVPAAAEADRAWGALAATLRAEGLARPVVAAAGVRERAGVFRAGGRSPVAWARRAPARLAAGALLVIGAAAAGRVSATRGPFATETGGPATFASSNDARETLARARRDYARAAAFLAAADEAGDVDDGSLADLDRGARPGADAELLRARLATLDALLPRVRAAARQAPEDPAVNQLYLAAYDARETALRQLGRTLPAGVQLTGY